MENITLKMSDKIVNNINKILYFNITSKATHTLIISVSDSVYGNDRRFVFNKININDAKYKIY
jgi:predicted nucleic acid-binding OB-fold protein